MTAVLAVYFYRRKQAAERQAQKSNALLSDFMAMDFMLKNSAFESYKQMLRNPNPRPEPPPFELSWEELHGNRRRF